MPSEAEVLQAMLAEFVSDCRSLLGHAEEAREHLDKGDLESVKQVVGISSYKINSVTTDRDAILERLAG